MTRARADGCLGHWHMASIAVVGRTREAWSESSRCCGERSSVRACACERASVRACACVRACVRRCVCGAWRVRACERACERACVPPPAPCAGPRNGQDLGRAARCVGGLVSCLRSACVHWLDRHARNLAPRTTPHFGWDGGGGVPPPRPASVTRPGGGRSMVWVPSHGVYWEGGSVTSTAVSVFHVLPTPTVQAA